jgi:hypothetical protein
VRKHGGAGTLEWKTENECRLQTKVEELMSKTMKKKIDQYGLGRIKKRMSMQHAG